MRAATLPTPAKRDPETFILPHNLDAERATIGAALIQSTAADYICDRLTPAAYFRRAHAVIYGAIHELRSQGTVVDFVTLKQRLEALGQLEAIGGPAYLAAFADGVPRSTNVEYYAGILKDLQAKRAIVAYASRTIDLVAAGEHSAAAVLADVDRRLMDLQAGHIEGRMQALAATASSLYSDLEWRSQHRGELTGVETGFASINEITLGWQPGDLVILGARPSIGKTSFVLNTAVHAARSCRADGTPRRVAIFSLEMRRRQLEYRILAQLSELALSRILGGYLADPDYPKLSNGLGAMHELRIEIDDGSGQTIGDIRAACRRLKAEPEGLDEVIIDYAQLMDGSLDRRGVTRNEELTDISRRSKKLAGELEVPILLLSQLNRDNEKRSDPRPRMSDLRDTGALEQDADVVAFLHRKNHREGGTTEFILEKQRNGPTGTVNLTFHRDLTTFTDGGEAPPVSTPAPGPVKKTRRRPHS